MFWFLVSPVWATIGAIVGITLGIIFLGFSLFIALLPSIFQALIWIIRIAGQIIFYSLICLYLILEWVAKKVRKAIYSDEFEALHF